MRLSDIPLLTFALVGVVSLLPDFEPSQELYDSMITVCRVCVALLFLDYFPRMVKRLGDSDVKDLLITMLPAVGVGLAIYAINPDADPDTMEYIAIVAVFLTMAIVKICRRHFIKKNGYLVASSEKDEIRN